MHSIKSTEAAWLRFSAGDAAIISGRSHESQRQDRFNGYLPSIESGKASYIAPGLAELLVLQALAERGMGPSQGIRLARFAGPHVAYWSLSEVGAILDKSGEQQLSPTQAA